jgi:prepilin signal peptidase PulO-like enzyme (type II secretory pathway)
MYEFHLDPAWIEILLTAMMGLLFGSFVTLASYRLPREEEGVVLGRSRCPSCRHSLGVRDLVPFFSWAVMRGKCRYCQIAIGWKYPAIELLQASLFLGVYFVLGLSTLSLLLMLLSVCLLLVIIIDFEFLIIPDELNLAMAMMGILYAFLVGHLLEGVLSACGGVLIGLVLRWVFTHWKKIEALGLGDVKFLGVSGLFLGGDLFITFFFMAGVIGLIIAALWQLAGKGRQFPFGPALAFSLYVCVLASEALGALREQVVQLLLSSTL